MINGLYDVYETYTAKIVVFENDLLVESVSAESLESKPLLKPASGKIFGPFQNASVSLINYLNFCLSNGIC